MTSLRETLAQLPTTTVEVIGIGAHQQPTLAAITLGHGQTALTLDADTSDGWIYWCGDCVTWCNVCNPG
jgi:hypothetical protein